VPTAPANSSASAFPTPISITVNYAGDSATGQAASSSVHPKTAKLTDHALRQVKAKHHPKVHESVIEQLARIHVSTKKQTTTRR
jgi:hypothetical protein